MDATVDSSDAHEEGGLSIDLPKRDIGLFLKFYIVFSPVYSFVYIIADHIEFKLPEHEIMDHEID
jgi:hypothetical protein